MGKLKELLAKCGGEYAEALRHIEMRRESIAQLEKEVHRLEGVSRDLETAMQKLRQLIDTTTDEGVPL